jgi:hypothetical protein
MSVPLRDLTLPLTQQGVLAEQLLVLRAEVDDYRIGLLQKFITCVNETKKSCRLLPIRPGFARLEQSLKSGILHLQCHELALGHLMLLLLRGQRAVDAVNDRGAFNTEAFQQLNRSVALVDSGNQL